MAVTIRKRDDGCYEVDIRIKFPDGTAHRERRKSPVSGKTNSMKWGQDRERFLTNAGPEGVRKPTPTLEEFSVSFLRDFAKANRQKPSTIAAKETIFRIHLNPFLGRKTLDEISSQDIQQLKSQWSDKSEKTFKSEKTVNNILSVLNKALKVAIEWEIIDRMSCKITSVKVPEKEAEFWDFPEYSSLVDASKNVGPLSHLSVLLAGDAGLRCGEIMALEWPALDFEKRQIRVVKSEWKGHVTDPKGRRTRTVPMTRRLVKALQDHRHLICDRVLCRTDGRSLSQKMVWRQVRKACKTAGLPLKGVHILRHTFCSHLAMRGAPASSIQQLAGHQDLTTTQRYMHLSPAAVDAAIKLLEEPIPSNSYSEELEGT